MVFQVPSKMPPHSAAFGVNSHNSLPAFVVSVKFQCLKGSIHVNFVSVFEAIGELSFGGVDPDRYTVYLMHLHTLREGFAAEPEYPKRRIAQVRCSGAPPECNIYLMRRLSCEFMECESGDEADHTPLDFEGNRGEVEISKSRHISRAL